MSPQGAPAVVARRSDVVWRRCRSIVLVSPLDSQDIRGIEGSGALVWNALDAPASVESLVRRLVGRVEGPRDPEALAAVLVEAVDVLRDAGLVVDGPPS